jgi:site-specific DNA recombinase
MNKELLAVAYVRVSTDDQANNGLSLEVQEEQCVNKIKEDGFTLYKIIRDEGKSGKNLSGRPGMREIVELVTAEKINAVYMLSSDRFARNVGDHIYLRDLLRKHNVELRFLNQQMDNSAMGITMDTVLASFNQMHSLLTSEKVISTIAEKVKAGYFPGMAPVGYKNVENPHSVTRLDRRMIAPSEMAPFITEIFNLYATGNYNGVDLNDLMYAKGLRAKNGAKLSISRFYEVIRNPIYIGEIHWGEIINKDAKHEPLINRATFEKVQAIWAGISYHASRRRKYQWLLNGFVFCPEHKRRYTAEFHPGKPAYYHCQNKSGCGKYVEVNTLEKAVAEKFNDLEFEPGFVEAVIKEIQTVYYKKREEYMGKRQGYINQKKAFEGKRKVAEDKLFTDLISDADFTRVRGEVAAQLANLDERIFELDKKQEIKMDVAQEILHFTRDVYDAYKISSLPLKRHFLGFFWERFEVYDGVIVNSCQSLLFRELLRYQAVSYKDGKLNKPYESKRISKVLLTHEVGA